MAWLRIPSGYVNALEDLLKLENSQVDELVSILERASATWDSDDLLAFVASELGKEQPVPTGIMALLLSLTALRLRLDLEPLKLASIVYEAMIESEYEQLKIQDKDPFIQRLTTLLSVESLLYPTKGPTVMLAHEYVFRHARIITDIRPIFGSDIRTHPSVAMLVHTLELTCQQGDNVRNFYVAMDKDDVNLLKEVSHRALLKADNLRSVLQQAGMTTIWE